VVRVQKDGMSVFGFLMEGAGEAEAVVFLPNAPSAFSGSVAVVALDRIEPTDLSVTDVLNAMRSLGVGLAGAARQ
jgi:uncharacterized membrane protein